MAPKFNPNADYSAAQFDPSADYSAADSGAADAPTDNAAPAPMDRTAGNYARESAYGVGRGLNNLVQGGYQTLRHPIDTATGMARQLKTADEASQKEYDDLKGQGQVARNVASMLTFAENAPMIGGMVQRAESGGTKPGSPEAVGAGVEAATTFGAPELIRLAPRAVRATADAVAGTGPRVTKALVKDTQAANAADATKVGDANSIAALKAEATRRAELSKHAEAKSTVEAKNQAIKAKLESDLAAQRKIGPITRKLTNARAALRAAVETAREKALKVGNEKYTTVRDALNSIEARPDFANDLDVLATQNIPGSKGAPTILKSIAKRAASQEPIRYEDLQADYSTLGNELSKGTLDGTTYHAYDQMHEAIGKEMQGLADENGMGEQLTAARDYWRRMKQTFGKQISFTDAASKTLGGLKDETQENQIRLLGSFDPEIPKLFNHVSNIEKGVEAQPNPVPERVLTTKAAESRVAPPKLDLTPRPEPKLPAPRKIGAEDVQAAKSEARGKRAGEVRRIGHRAALYGMVDAPVEFGLGVAMGSPLLETIGLLRVPGALATGEGIARILENPRFVKFVSQATPRDVAQIPADIRGDFPNLVKAAQAKGIKVSPALLGIAAVSGMPAPRAKHPTDVYQDMEP